jgi:excisionase family DNA binding protein
MPKPPETRPLLTVEDAARLAQTSTKWIYAQIRLRRLRAIHLGRAIRITWEDWEAFLKLCRD